MVISNRDAAAILAEARKTIGRTEHVGKPPETGGFGNPAETADFLPPFEDRLERWKREANERAEARECERARSDLAVIERRVTDRVYACLQSQLAAMINDEHKHMVEMLLPELVAALKQSIADDVTIEIERAYKLAMAELRADLNALREALKKIAGDGAIIDLPPLPSWRNKPLN
jgi:hypothetical protein